MIPGLGYTRPSFTTNPYGNRSFRPTEFHAAQFHAPRVPTIASRTDVNLNHYVPDATLRVINNGKVVGAHTQLKPGEIVEITRPGHQTELQYATYQGHLAPLNQATINHVPNEIRDHIKKVGGPSYFAHELHNRFATSGLDSQFKGQRFSGPNRPLI